MLKSSLKNIPLLAGIPFSEIAIKKLGGLSNQNYLLSIAKQQFVLRIPTKSGNHYISRENESYNAEIAFKLGISPETLWRNSEGLSLTRYLENAPTLNSSDLQDSNILKKIAQLRQLLHSSQHRFKGTLRPINISQLLSNYFKACSKKDQQILHDDYQTAQYLLQNLKDKHPLVASHGDLIPENILLQGNKLWLIDWEYSTMASPFWDLAMLCHHGELNEKTSHCLLKEVIGKHTTNDWDTSLRKYQHIVKSISDCWLASFRQ